MEVICLEDSALYALVEQVVQRLQLQHNVEKDEWVPPSEAMRILNVKSKTTLQSLRDTGKIRFSQPQKRIILYDRGSLIEYLEQHSKNTF